MPSPISIIPAKISKFLVGKFFNFPPSLKPRSELMKVITVINIAGFRILFPDSKSENYSERSLGVRLVNYFLVLLELHYANQEIIIFSK